MYVHDTCLAPEKKASWHDRLMATGGSQAPQQQDAANCVDTQVLPSSTSCTLNTQSNNQSPRHLPCFGAPCTQGKPCLGHRRNRKGAAIACGHWQRGWGSEGGDTVCVCERSLSGRGPASCRFDRGPFASDSHPLDADQRGVLHHADVHKAGHLHSGRVVGRGVGGGSKHANRPHTVRTRRCKRAWRYCRRLTECSSLHFQPAKFKQPVAYRWQCCGRVELAVGHDGVGRQEVCGSRRGLL